MSVSPRLMTLPVSPNNNRPVASQPSNGAQRRLHFPWTSYHPQARATAHHAARDDDTQGPRRFQRTILRGKVKSLADRVSGA